MLCSEEEYWAKLCCPIIIVLSCKSGYLFTLDLDNTKMFGVNVWPIRSSYKFLNTLMLLSF